METPKPGIDTQLRGAAQREEGLEKSMAFSAVRRALLGSAADDTELPDEDLGKYRVLERLGAGGMGAVFAAWDPQLERRVALKVLTGDRAAKDEQSLIMREAKAAAQLSHPNVVTVFEVGVAQGRVFLAMEYIRGETLRMWSTHDPSASARLDVLLQAGRGLAAAHDRGLVHRDFKPDNVLVDAKGKAKVVDFGLAHSIAERLDEAAADGDTREDRGATLTQTGPRSGTPDYMAPEQFAGEAADARTDQFAFAVTAWELLCGERPFASNEQARAPHGRPVAGVPRGVSAALTRALSPDPADRFASMQQLLRHIDPAPRAARRSRILLGGAGLLTAGAIAWAAAARPEPLPAVALCTGAEAQLEGIWDESHRAGYATAFAAAAPTQGAELWATTADTLSRYVQDWVAVSTDACEATRVRGEQSDETFTLRTRCLHGHRRALAALLGRIPSLDAETVARVPAAAAQLPNIAACADPERLTSLVAPPPPQLADAVAALRDRLAEIEASEKLGQYKTVAAQMPALVQDALALDERPLHAEVKYWEGRVARRMAALPESKAALEQAVLHATATRHDHLLAETLGVLALLVGSDLTDKEAGLALADRAQAAIDRIGGDGELSAQLASRRGLIYLENGDLREARIHLLSAAEQFSSLDPDGIQLGDTLLNLSKVSTNLGDIDAAVTQIDGALTIFERRHGPNHTAVGMALVNRAVLQRKQEQLEAARDSYARAREVLAKTLGESHPNLSALDMNRGNLELDAGNNDAALRLLEDATAGLEAALGSEHLWVALAINSRGRARVETGDLEGGLADFQRAIQALVTASPQSVELGVAHCFRGSALAKTGDPAGAARSFSRAFAQFDRALQDDAKGHPDVLSCQAMQAEVTSTP